MSQTAYDEKPKIAMPGMIADNSPNRIRTGKFTNAAGGQFGTFVTKGAAEGDVTLLADANSKIAGLLVHTHHVDAQSAPAGKDLAQNDIVPVAEEGRFYVVIEEDMTEDDPVYVRHTANGAGKLQIGAVRKDADDAGGAKAVLLKGATVRRGGTLAGDGVAVISFNLEASRV